MLPLTYHRSSSITNWKLCQQQFFLTYILGLRQKPNLKAQHGTCVHKVLELLAICKKNLQEGKDHLIDNEIGINLKIPNNWLEPYTLSNVDVDKINSTRINKDTYKWDCNIKYGHIRYGVEFVEKLIKICFDYFSSKSSSEWKNIDFKNITNFVWITLDYQNRQFDPRTRHIVSTEKQFDLEIPEQWADYEYSYRGKNIDGTLRIKGTIDLITQVDENTIEILDFKTGQRKDWKTNEPKTYKKLHEDSQLLMYYYAATRLYPNKNVLISIFFIRDGGPYTLCYDDVELQTALAIFKNVKEEVNNCKLPILLDHNQQNFMCRNVCDYYKQKINNKNVCKFIHDEIQKYGIDAVIDMYTAQGFDPNYYQSPGEVE